MDVIAVMKSVGAILTDDHFVYTSGKHGSVYVNKDALYPHTALVSQVGEEFSQRCKQYKPDIVVGPALGGIILSQWTAHHLSVALDREILGIYTEKDANKNQIFTRGYNNFVKGKQVLVIEDLTTTGGSVLKVVQTVRNSGGIVAAVAVMVNRNPKEVTTAMFDCPFEALAELPAEAWEEQEMPVWLQDRPINTTVGHGKKYLEAKS